jgi:uncharacterized protein (DUF1810 family)
MEGRGMSDDDPYDLQRFVDAQARDFAQACDELRQGRKRTHWIWYVFPQMKGLGSSGNATAYGIGSADEARAYLAHPILGPRLLQVTQLMLDQAPRTPTQVLGSPDDMKFRSCMTLFANVAGSWSVFRDAIDILCAGNEDPARCNSSRRTADGAPHLRGDTSSAIAGLARRLIPDTGVKR